MGSTTPLLRVLGLSLVVGLSPEVRRFLFNHCPHSLSLLSSKTNALNVSQKMIEMFVRTKHKIDKSHEFALVVVNDDTAWVSLGQGWGSLGSPGGKGALC